MTAALKIPIENPDVAAVFDSYPEPVKGALRSLRALILHTATELDGVGEIEEALRWGLVNQVVEPDRVLRRSLDVASTIAGQGPIAARYLKEAVLKGLDMTLEQGLRLEADLSFLLQSTTDRAEGIQSFLEKRKPEYKGD